MDSDTFLVTGAMGCIGAWTAAHLVEEGQQVIAFDLNPDTRRIELLLKPADLEKIVFEEGDLTDFNCVSGLLERHSVDHVIHLAALQVPFCQADPVQGARVNVVGTVNLFEAARQASISHLAYASSVAVYGPVGDDMSGPLPEEAARSPRTMYGVFKQANEGTAGMYWSDYGVSSIGLRPHTVYGPGRDQGITSDPSKAMLAAAAGEPFTIQYSNGFLLQFASDVARQFIEASRHPGRGNHVFNLGGEAPSMAGLIGMIRDIVPGARIDFLEHKFPIPELMDSTALHKHFARVSETPLLSGIEQTIQMFRQLLAEGKLSARQE